MKSSAITIPISESEKVSGVLSVPDSTPKDAAIIVAHGAGNDMNYPLLQFFAEGLAEGGYVTLRFNFLYREKGKKSPDSQDLLYIAWQGAYRFLADHPDVRPKQIVAAGKSLGGRIASQMVSEGVLPVGRLIFLGYPLHAPGRKERLKDGHLYEIPIPMLFFAGTRDHLCDLELLRGVLDRLKAPHELDVIEGGDHSFNIPKSSEMSQEGVYLQVLNKTLEWLNMQNL
jgi:predicted alpha/beta-hydrolase family hydrolase